MDDAERYRQEQDFLLEELTAKRSEAALARALKLGVRTIEYRLGFMTLDQFEEAIAKKEESK